jgi:cell division protein FtsW
MTRLPHARLVTAALLAVLCALQLFALLRAPAAWLPERIAVSLARGQSTFLGRAALAAPQADERQLRLRRDAAGVWWIANASPVTPLQLVTGAPDPHAMRTGSVVLAAGKTFRLGAATFAVTANGPDGIVLSDAGLAGAPTSRAGARWRYDGAVLRRSDGHVEDAPQTPCPGSHAGARLAAAWNRIAPRAFSVARPLVFGGNLDCGNRIAIPNLPAPAATMARMPAGIVLSAGAAPLLLDGAPLAEHEERLDGKTAIVAGRTRLAIDTDGDRLYLRPLAHVALHAVPQDRLPQDRLPQGRLPQDRLPQDRLPQGRLPQGGLPDGVAWTWVRRGDWTLAPAGVAATLAILACAACAAVAAALHRTGAGGRRARVAGVAAGAAVHRTRAGGGRAGAAGALRLGGAVFLAGAGIGLLIMQRGGAPAGPGVALLVAWAALWFLLLAVAGPRAALAPCAATLLLAIGLLAQLDLGLGAPESSWLRHFHKSAAVLALGVGAMALARAWMGNRRPLQPQVEAGLLLLAGLALAALLAQVAYGDETGVFDLQPVEFAKLALAALTAHCLALDSGAASHGRPSRRWLLSLAPSLLFLALLAVALVQVDDYSPLVLLTVWAGTLALAHALATGRRALAGLLGACALGAVLVVAALHGAGAGQVAQWHFYADRFLVWLDPGAHPHTGQQLLLGARAIAQGGWSGADGAGGLLALGGDAGSALRVPAVQDDFAAAFFLQRHGLAAGLALWTLQVLFVGGLLHLALGCWWASVAARDFRTAWLARLRCFGLAGGAAFTFGHFLLSWGTNLGILPIMGQPMSFLSAGGSHLLFFICPLLGLAVATSHTIEENDDAGLRPT